MSAVTKYHVLGLVQVQERVKLVLLDLKYEFSELLNLVRVTLTFGHLPLQKRPVVASLWRRIFTDLRSADLVSSRRRGGDQIILKVDSLRRGYGGRDLIVALGVKELIIAEALILGLLLLLFSNNSSCLVIGS